MPVGRNRPHSFAEHLLQAVIAGKMVATISTSKGDLMTYRSLGAPATQRARYGWVLGLAAALVVAGAVVPRAAAAATLAVQSGFLAQYTATPGEANNLRVESSCLGGFGCQQGRINFFDSAPIFVGTGCTRSATGAQCTATRARVTSGDLNDIVNASTSPNFIIVSGGPGDDQITGSARGEDSLGTSLRDSLSGDDGADTLDGGPRSDRIVGGAGIDRILGRTGEDTILARDGVADQISCGDDLDEAELDLTDRIPADCELVSQAAIDEGPNLVILTRALRVRGRSVRVRLRCPSAQDRNCSGRLTLKRVGANRPTLAAASYRLAHGRRTTVSLTISAQRLAVLRSQGVVRVQLRALERDSRDRAKTTIARLRLRTR